MSQISRYLRLEIEGRDHKWFCC